MRRTLLSLLTALSLSVALAACGDDTEEPTASDGESSAGAEAADVFPVTVEHAFGSTTIESKPERIATVAWANHEVPLALGVVPVGMSEASWGDDDGDGVLPWVEEKLEELGADTPALFDETDGIAFEAVAATQPDLILATYSGLTETEYETLSKIAPVVAYPDIAWATTVQDMITLSSTAMGMADEGEALVADLDAQVQEAYASHPELDGKSIMFSYIDPTDLSQVGFYTTHDTRPGFLADMGMTMPEVVTTASAETEEFYVTRSAEDLDAFDDVDIFVTYGDAEGELVDTITSDPVLSQIPAIERGSIAVLEDSTPLAASANPSPLSIGWGIEEYFDLLAAAVAPAA
ncbi:iron-siderophore ABC transporter substrate-binding protein [Nocardioides sp.]|uniref:iron-siderophore ABC transporter substrate-binding protein n=1 Tax=Nocardioides sp. TaxID=35761 RepID=UPI0025D80A00|nr:iron-siderophore ABC transporter substrate-binding protein [Nocardioides sp.]